MTPFALLAPTYLQMLGALSNWLDKAEAELPEAEVAALPSARLAPDMFPLATQVRFACAQALEGVHRLQGASLPPLHAILLEEGREAGDRPGSLSEARSRIAETIALVSVHAESEGSDGTALIAHELPNGMVFDLTEDQYGRDWALGQFYFHIMIAYAILRHKGVGLGKADYVAHMFGYLRPGTLPTT